MAKTLNIGLDVGSTTVKVVVMDNKNQILYDDYQRHFSDTKKTIDHLCGHGNGVCHRKC